MGKLKGFIAIISALALIFLTAYFPKIISMFLDWRNTGNASYNPIASIQLEIKTDISPLGRLAMLSRMDGNIELSESKAKMSKEKVMEAVYYGLQPYIDSQLAVYSEQDVQMHPSLIQVQNDQALQGIVWMVTVSGDPANFTFFDMIIDDETGHILRINYTSEALRDTLIGTEALYAFSDIYFTSLGIDDYTHFAASDLEYAYLGDNTTAIRYRFGDALYGEINIDLYVHDRGFYVEFPNV